MKPSSFSTFYPSRIRSFVSFAVIFIRYLSFILLVLHLFPIPESLLCLGINSISSNQKVRDGETIVSAGGMFELGFFSRTASNNLRYVGIWLNNILDEKVVWVANRENSVRDLSGVLLIANDGNLVIVDGANNTIWSTNITLESNHTFVELSDAGNLLLKENSSNGVILRESFSHPTDSLLPGMKIGINTKTGEQIVPRSWKDDADPSIGNFALVVDPQEIPQCIIMNSSAKYWRTGQWTGRYFVGIPIMVGAHEYDFVTKPQEGTIYFTYTSSSNNTILPILYLTYKGDFMQIYKDEDDNQWLNETIAPIGQCDLYNTCGPFGRCNSTNSPICNCLHGYEPANYDEWKKGNWTSGCKRRTKFSCEKNTSSANDKADGFLTMTRMKLPDFSHRVPVDNMSMCKSICLTNCSCVAYAIVNGIGCLLWGENLVDIQEFPYFDIHDIPYENLIDIPLGDVEGMGGQELHIRLANSELDGQSDAIIPKEGTPTSRDVQQRYSLRNEIRRGGNLEVPSFTLKSIEAATNKFSLTNKLGEGGFGPVYKGKLPDGQEIAVKRLSRSSGQGTEEFKNEVILISRLQHRSLVKLLGFCIQGDETLLIYEYMPNKSLDKLIFGSTEKELPDWSLRFKIIEGIARGLLYLHRDSRLKIIHRDLKASNILLDEHMNPKISDFGMARIFRGDQSIANTNRVVGTYGYMSPEYAMQGIFSEKSDVFSFGVLLLEVVSSKKNNAFYHYVNPQTLLNYAWQLWNEGKAVELLDPRLDSSSNVEQVNRCIHVALLCVQQHAHDRPTMLTVVSMLCNEASLTIPDRPAFSSNERLDESNLSFPESLMCSTNDCSITTVVGR